MRHEPGHGKRLSYYEFGATSLFACQMDQRFSYCLYIPRAYDEDGTNDYPLVVLIHGTERGAQRYRDEFIEFAEQHQCIVLAPLFPCGILKPGELDNYKFIRYQTIRYDEILLSMVAEISARYRLNGARFLIHGFSGGGHFVHRFLYLHSERLAGASIGAPGLVTLLDPGKPWWVGTGNLRAEFGIEVDLAKIRKVPVQMVVGAADTETWEITPDDKSPRWMPGINDAGKTRIERLQALHRCFLGHGIGVRFDLVPNVGHEGWDPALLARVKDFFASTLGGKTPLQAHSGSAAPVKS
ncbi:MAG: hydrolase [Verrucomicrobia bacterium]|nr:hydrolase [Verrucomicrobiota bacterium]